MDISLNNVDICEMSSQTKTVATVETDIIVPDTKPDIYRVLSVTAFADSAERSIKKDKVIFSGNVKFNILYSGEDDPSKIISLDFIAPLSHQTDIMGIDEDFMCVCSSDVSKTSFEVKNSRKLCVSAFVSYNIQSHKTKSKEIICPSHTDVLYPHKKGNTDCDCLLACKDLNFDISETFSMPCSDEATICKIGATVEISDVKSVNNKAVLKGQLNIKVLYETNGEISDYLTEFSFTEVCDIENLTSEHRLFYNADVAYLDYTTDYSDVGMSIDARIKVKGYMCVYEHREIFFVNDIYSPDYEYEKKAENISVTTLSSLMQTRDTVKDSIELPISAHGIEKIHNMECFTGKAECVIDGDTLKLNGNIEINLIYSDENNVLCRAIKTSPYEFEFAYSKPGDDYLIIPCVKCLNSGYVMGSAEDVQLRVVVNAEAVVLSRETFNVVCEFNADSKKPIKKDDQPSIVVFYPGSSSELWDIAKKYNTTCEEIAEINSLDLSLPLSSDTPILIPKRHI